MKRTRLKRKTPLRAKKGLNRGKNGLKRTKLHVVGQSSTSQIKREIQALLREIVILRDGGCILRDRTDVPPCNGYRKDGELILQADHLLSRAHSATYSDSRLVVCVCKGHHGWKSVGNNLRKSEYDNIVKEILPKERVELWEKCEKEQWKPTKVDWALEKAALEQELKKLKNGQET